VPLDDPACAFSEVFPQTRLPRFDGEEKSKGADNVCLVTDVNDQPYLIGFTATAGILDHPDKDYAELYRVDLDRKVLEPVVERHMVTRSGVHFPILGGVSFRYGAGLRILSATRLAFFCSARNFQGGLSVTLKVNEFLP